MSSVAAPLPVRLARLVRLEHTVFALPFAYVGALLAVGGWPGLEAMAWITVAMVGARTLAMGLNRLVDAEVDARNPRTAGREIPAGVLTRLQVAALCVLALGVYLVAVWQLNPLVRWLWPIPVVMFVVYPYLKRVTWLCHLWLGASLGLAPVGAWAAVTGELPWQAWALGGAVCLWVAGFDLFYALFDRGARPRGGAPFVGHAVRRPRRLRGRARDARRGRATPRRRGSRARRRRLVLGRCRGRGGPAHLRARHRASRRPPPARRGVLHGERRPLDRLLRVRRARHDSLTRARGTRARSGGCRPLVTEPRSEARCRPSALSVSSSPGYTCAVSTPPPRHSVDAKAAPTRHTFLDSVTSGHRGCPWGWLTGWGSGRVRSRGGAGQRGVRLETGDPGVPAGIVAPCLR